MPHIHTKETAHLSMVNQNHMVEHFFDFEQIKTPISKPHRLWLRCLRTIGPRWSSSHLCVCVYIQAQSNTGHAKSRDRFNAQNEWKSIAPFGRKPAVTVLTISCGRRVTYVARASAMNSADNHTQCVTTVTTPHHIHI